MADKERTPAEESDRTPHDPDVDAALEAHHAVIEEYRDVFRKLAE